METRPNSRGAMVVVLLALVATLAACASTPQASSQRDSEAKRFGSAPKTATLYVYRTDTAGYDSVLWVNGRLIGATLPHTFFRIHLNPGRHLITGMAADNGRITLDARPGEIYFVSLALAAGQSHFQLVPPQTGQKVLTNCCSLLENWAPGQRPLLR